MNVSMPIRFFLDKVSQCGIDPGNSSLEIRDRPFTPGSCPLIVGQAEERGRTVMQRSGNLRPPIIFPVAWLWRIDKIRIEA